MGTAPTKSRATGRLARHAHEVRVPESMKVLISEDGSRAHHGRIVACDVAALAQSGSFASYDRAEQAAQRVREGAALFNRRGRELGDVDLAARRDRPRDDVNAERRLDAGGSFTREAVARWPDHR
jgi:hypothetical protein